MRAAPFGRATTHFSRAKIEQAIKFDGFQLWRMKSDTAKPGDEAHTQAA
jgi:hypothetical protein